MVELKFQFISNHHFQYYASFHFYFFVLTIRWHGRSQTYDCLLCV